MDRVAARKSTQPSVGLLVDTWWEEAVAHLVAREEFEVLALLDNTRLCIAIIGSSLQNIDIPAVHEITMKP